MAAQKKRSKKNAPGGATGAPPRSEPKVQLFSKFNGCDFRLSTRNFDDIFAEDQDTQTDLMPMFMAIQNNADVIALGGIETRQNLVHLFDAPDGKQLTGVATLIGDVLYAACGDETVHFGELDSGSLSSAITIEDRNGAYAPPTRYNEDADAVAVAERIESQWTPSTTKTLTEKPISIGPFTPSMRLLSGITTKLKQTTGQRILYSQLLMNPNDKNLVVVADSTTVVFNGAQDAEVHFDFADVPLTQSYYYLRILAMSGGYTGLEVYSSDSPDSPDSSYYLKIHVKPTAVAVATHTVVDDGIITKLSLYGFYPEPGGPEAYGTVKVYDGDQNTGTLILTRPLNTLSGDIVLGDLNTMEGYEVSTGDTITVVIELTEEVLATAVVVFYEAVDNNTWTFLGHADDQLVGMTANRQIWTAPVSEFKLENALQLDAPASLQFTDLAPTGLTLSATDTQPYRVSICHTLLNRFGPTLPSDPLTFWASKPVSEWSSTEYVTLSGSVGNYDQVNEWYHGITGIELYFTDDNYQEFAFIARVNIPDVVPTGDPLPLPDATKDWLYVWTGYQMDTSSWPMSNLTVPDQNYTLGAPASKMTVIDGRLYFWGGEDGYRIWIGGNPGNRFSVSPGTGGGFVDVEPGTGTVVSNVLKFKTQQGASIVTALCDNPNSHKEYRYNLVETNISLSNEQSMKSWQAEKIAGTVGCKSSSGALATGDGLYAVSRYGLALTTLTMEYNSQLQVMYVSDPISPVFLKQYGTQLDVAVLFEVNGVLYMTFGSPDGTLDNVIFCYDIGLKAWWTYTVLDTTTTILNMIHIDYEGGREGIGIITRDAVYLLPTTMSDDISLLPAHDVIIESAELSTMTPLQAMHHISQLEFRFDYFVGTLVITVTMIDQFGRRITTERTVSHDAVQHQLSEYIRIDQTVESYSISMRGAARFRLTHFLAKVYPKSNRIGMVYGFDSRQSHLTPGSIRHTFTSYNDLREAIIP